MLQLYLYILYFVFALANQVKMFNHPPPLLHTVVICSLNSASILATTGERTQFGCINIQQLHPLMMLYMAFCNRAKELGARDFFIMPSPSASTYIVIELNSCPIQHLVPLHVCFLYLLDTKNSCSFLFVVSSSMSCVAIITSLQLYVYLSLRQNVQYVEYYGHFLRQTTSGCTFVKWIAMTK